MPTYGYLLPTRGIVLTSGDTATLTAKVQSDVVGLARRAESTGFDGVWVGDSVLAKPRLEPMTTLAAAAAATESVELGTAVYLPPLRHAAHVAHMTATVDQLSGGRLVLGVGVGRGTDVEAEYANLDAPFDRRGARLDETLDVMRGLWEGEPLDYDGEEYDLSGASIGFEPARTPPVYVASSAFDPARGFPRPVHDRILAHGDGWLPTGFDPETYAAGIDRIRSSLEDAGRDPSSFGAAYYLDVVIDDSEARALDAARRFHARYYPDREELTDEQLRARGAFGPAGDVASIIDAYADAGVERFVVRFTADDQREQLRRFSSAVR